MSLEANDLLLFARVADAGSFSRAAESLRLPKSTVSRRVAALETQLGERLLLRTTRKLHVTDFGRSVLDHAHHVAEEVDAAASLALQRKAQPSGRLRVSMPGDLASLVFSDLFAEFVARYPAIDLEIDLSPRRVDLIGENFDVAIRMGDLPDDASLAARRIAIWSGGLFAAPAYIARRGQPPEPEALMEHDALRLLLRSGEPTAVDPRARRTALGRHSARARHRQLARPPDPPRARGGGHRGGQAPLRRTLRPQRRTRSGASRLADARRRSVGGVPGTPAHARAHARVPRCDRGEILGAGVQGDRSADARDDVEGEREHNCRLTRGPSARQLRRPR